MMKGKDICRYLEIYSVSSILRDGLFFKKSTAYCLVTHWISKTQLSKISSCKIIRTNCLQCFSILALKLRYREELFFKGIWAKWHVNYLLVASSINLKQKSMGTKYAILR